VIANTMGRFTDPSCWGSETGRDACSETASTVNGER
jgi:hypothetical protein